MSLIQYLTNNRRNRVSRGNDDELKAIADRKEQEEIASMLMILRG